MSRAHALRFGLKILGVYFAVSAIARLAVVLFTLAPVVAASVLGRMSSQAPDGAVGDSFVIERTLRFDLVAPIVFAVAAYLLLRRMDWCVRTLHRIARPDHPHQVA
jgi:hypothetical protein